MSLLPSQRIATHDKRRIGHPNPYMYVEPKPLKRAHTAPRCAACRLVTKPQWGEKRCKCAKQDINVPIDNTENT